jgi:glycosyltransferase involved in cell wall biosynthesis
MRRLVPPGDHVAMANAVQSLLANPVHRRALVDAAFRRVNEHYDTKKMAAGYASLIEAAARH